MAEPRGTRTQVGIVGAGPAGLVLAQLLRRHGIESVVLEARSREYCEQRIRAGVLEHGTVELLDANGVGERMRREGLVHDGIYLRFGGRSRHIDFPALTGKTITVYGQHEVVKDLIAAHARSEAPLHFDVSDVAIDERRHRPPDDPLPRRRRRAARARVRRRRGLRRLPRHRARHDPGRRADGVRARLSVRVARHLGRVAAGRARADLRAPRRAASRCSACARRRVSACICSARPTKTSRSGPTSASGTSCTAASKATTRRTSSTGAILEKGVTAMRSFVVEPMQYGRLFLAGDAAHIVPPTGAKGMNLAIADVAVLAARARRVLRRRRYDALDAYARAACGACGAPALLVVDDLDAAPRAGDRRVRRNACSSRSSTTSRARTPHRNRSPKTTSDCRWTRNRPRDAFAARCDRSSR